MLAFCASAGVHASDISSSAMDPHFLLQAARLADASAGMSSPHPNSACLIVKGYSVVGDGFLQAQGTTSAEVLACQKARELAKGATAYLNLEPGDCHGDDSAVSALKQAGVSRVVIGLRHPLPHFRNKAINELRLSNTKVDVLGEDLTALGCLGLKEALKACKEVNAPLLYRAVHNLPMSTLKFAMTLDGKIAASTGHASWISSKMSRERVFATRRRSDAVIVGGNTVRRDNPSLTTRTDSGQLPTRIVMSQFLDLPEEANLWDVSSAPTIVMTQKGSRKDFQRRLEKKGVEIVEFDFLTPNAVAEYCYSRGFLNILWECGGTLAAPAIASGAVHKVTAFIAPKIIGGVNAPSPVGELGFTEMTQALNLTNVSLEQIGPDILVSGYLHPIPDISSSVVNENGNRGDPVFPEKSTLISFNKTWDVYGAFSNYSPHPITVIGSEGKPVQWDTVEHYYQAQKFEGVEHPAAVECIKNICSSQSPEMVTRLAKCLQRQRPDLVRSDWDSIKLEVMYSALHAKFTAYSRLNSLLLSTGEAVLADASPSDLFWGYGREGEGLNCLGRLLMKLRTELREEEQRRNSTGKGHVGKVQEPQCAL